MKIAIVTPYWMPVRGGITTYAAQLTEALRAAGHEVIVIAREGGDPGATTLGGTGRAFARAAAESLRSFGPDAVHAHGHWYALAAALRQRRRDPRCRVVFTLHTPYPGRPWWRRRAFRALLSRADFVTGVSAELLGSTLRALPFRTRTRVTYAGVVARMVPSRDSREFLHEFHLEGRRPLVGCLGRLSWEGKVRGVADLIRAMGRVRAEIPGATLAVAGDGPHRAALEALAAAQVPGGVVFLGDIPDPAPRFYTAIEVYAHISYQEGLPLALLEAMACQNAVVTTRVGGMPEAIRDGHNGSLVSGDPEEVARKILAYLQDPDLARLHAGRAQATVESQFRWPVALRRFLPLYGAPVPEPIAVSIDAERDYHADGDAFRGIEEALPVLLGLLERHGVRAEVFATADLAARFPDRLRDARSRGHAVGCHGESHDVEYLSRQPDSWQRGSLARATEALADVLGERPTAFRAPNFSLGGGTVRALESLGYRWDSSVLPGRVVRRARIEPLIDFTVAPRDPYRPSRDDPAIPGDATLWEIPVTENPLAPGGPIGLGFLHARGADATLEALRRAAGSPRVFLIHPWELLDPPAKGPEWTRTACRSDPAALDAFLGRVAAELGFTTLEDAYGAAAGGVTGTGPSAAPRSPVPPAP